MSAPTHHQAEVLRRCRGAQPGSGRYVAARTLRTVRSPEGARSVASIGCAQGLLRLAEKGYLARTVVARDGLRVSYFQLTAKGTAWLARRGLP